MITYAPGFCDFEFLTRLSNKFKQLPEPTQVSLLIPFLQCGSKCRVGSSRDNMRTLHKLAKRLDHELFSDLVSRVDHSFTQEVQYNARPA